MSNSIYWGNSNILDFSHFAYTHSQSFTNAKEIIHVGGIVGDRNIALRYKSIRGFRRIRLIRFGRVIRVIKSIRVT